MYMYVVFWNLYNINTFQDFFVENFAKLVLGE